MQRFAIRLVVLSLAGVLAGCQGSPARPADGAAPPLVATASTVRGTPEAQIQGSPALRRINTLIGQWDLAQSEGMTAEAQRIAAELEAETDAVFPELVAAAEGQRGTTTQFLGTSALGFTTNPGATAVLARRLQERDPRLVGNALVALNERADPATPLEPVLHYLDPRAPELPKRYAPLVFATVHDARQRAGNPLPRELEQTVVPRLVSISNDPDGYTRLHVAKALGRVGGVSEAAVDALLLRMGDDQMRVRWAAAAALERSGSPRGFPEVVRLLHDVAPASKHVIRDVLVSYAGRLQGRPLGDEEVASLGLSAAQWSRWHTAWLARSRPEAPRAP